MNENHDDLNYSTDALNVLDDFHGAKYVVYVEGDDDINFWNAQFRQASIDGAYIKQAGGKLELQKIMSQILDDDARVIVICDSDYSTLLHNIPIHDRIIATYGYSIENTMYCPCNINRISSELSRETLDLVSEITAWLNQFCESAKKILVYDFARSKYNKTVYCSGDRCTRFLKSQKSIAIDETKIDTFIRSIQDSFSPSEINDSESIIASSSLSNRYLMNGHFLTNAVVNWIKRTVKKLRGSSPVIPMGLFYPLASQGCFICAEECEESKYISQKLEKATESLLMI